MNLATAFEASAEKNAAKTAVFWGDAEYSYQRMGDQAARVAARLQTEFQIDPGDRVGLWLKTCAEFIAAVFGVLQAGGVVVPSNNVPSRSRGSHMQDDAGAKV